MPRSRSLFAGLLGVLLALSACSSAPASAPASAPSSAPASVSAPGPEAASVSPSSPESTPEPARIRFSDEMEALLAAGLNEPRRGEPLLDFLCRDFDGDGKEEAFALTGTVRGDFCDAGHLWFVPAAGEPVPLETGRAYEMPLRLWEMPDGVLLVKTESTSFGSGSTSLVYRVEGGDAERIFSDGSQAAYLEDGRFSVVHGSYSAATDRDGNPMGGHCYPAYPYAWDGKLTEQGGIPVSEAALRGFENAAVRLDGLLADGFGIGPCYYHTGGLVAVNYHTPPEITPEEDLWYENHYLLYRLENDVLIDCTPEYADGVYQAAATESAVFSDSLPAALSA